MRTWGQVRAVAVQAAQFVDEGRANAEQFGDLRDSQAILNVAAFTVIGLALFGLAFFLMGKVTPFSLCKEKEEDQNIALAIVMAPVIIGIAMIIVAGRFNL